MDSGGFKNAAQYTTAVKSCFKFTSNGPRTTVHYAIFYFPSFPSWFPDGTTNARSHPNHL